MPTPMDPHPAIHSEAVSTRYAQVLYRCLEEVGSAKGALYLRDAPDGAFHWICGYGWPRGAALPAALAPLDPLVILVSREKRGFAVRDAGDFPELAPFSQGARSARFFVTPIYDMGGWIGILLQRDPLKGGEFDPARHDKPTLAICSDLVALHRAALGPAAAPAREAEALPVPPAPPAQPAPAPVPEALQPRPAEGLIPDLPDDGVAEVRASTAPGTTSSLPWEQEQLAILGRLEPGKARHDGLPLEERRPGRFLPEQLTYFWEAAAVLLELGAADAAALWVEEADELRPVLVASGRPLSPDLRQQVMGQFAFNLPGIDPKFMQLLARPAEPDAPPMEGAFQACAKALLREEEGRRDLLLLFRVADRAFSGQETDRFGQLGRLLEMHLQEGRLHERYHRAFLSVSHRILKSGEGRHPSLHAHSLTTAKLARNLALRLELPSAEVEAVSIAAILHDVGTLMLDPRILAKARLTSEELAKVRTHPVLASTFLKDFKFPFDVLKIIRHHHERWDGRGYPDGLAGELIPIGSRIIGAIEAYEVMTGAVSYRAAMTRAQALDELQREAGSQFDPAVVEAFIKIMRKAR